MELSQVIEQRIVTAPAVGGDVTDEAVARGWVLPFAEGQYVYGAEWTRLARGIQRLLLVRAERLGFREYLFPRLIPAEAVDDFRLSQFKPGLLWRLDGGDRVLDPVQCLPFYHVLRGHRFGGTALPLKVVEAMGGWTWRREPPQELDGIFRAVEFARVEHVWLGTPEQVRDIRNEVLASVVGLLGELDLSVQTVVGEACMPLAEVESRMRAAASPRDVPVIDIELRVRPQRTPGGGLTPQDFDEVGGCTIEGGHHLETFDIRGAGEEPLWSGCCGVGLNRVVIGFLFQHGFEPASWPSLVTSAITAPAVG